MATTAHSRTADLEERKARYVDDAVAHDRQRVNLADRLNKNEIQRESRSHLEKIAAGDADSIRLDERLVKERITLEREISARKRLAEDSRREADLLSEQIAQARTAEIVARAVAKSVEWETGVVAVEPMFDGIRGIVEQSEKDAAEFDSIVAQFPESVRGWLGAHFAQRRAEQRRVLLLNEVQAVVSGKKTLSTDFSNSMAQSFSRDARLLETITATLAGGAPGREMYLVCDGSISGISGGLTVPQGDRICLRADDAETVRLIASGNLIVEGKK